MSIDLSNGADADADIDVDLTGETSASAAPSAGPSRLVSPSSGAGAGAGAEQTPAVSGSGTPLPPTSTLDGAGAGLGTGAAGRGQTTTGQADPARRLSPREPAYRLAQSIYAHKRAVTALKWSGDGRMLVSGGADGYLNVFSTLPTDTALGSNTDTQPTTASSSSCSDQPTSLSLSRHSTFRAHRSGINDLSLSPDDLYVATASDDLSVRVFLLPSAYLPPGFTSSARSGAAEPDDTPPSGSGSDSGAANGRRTGPASNALAAPLRTLEAHTAAVLCVAFSPKSNLLVSGSMDESAIVWDVRRGKALRTLPAHSEGVWCVAWDAAGVMVLTGSADGLVRLWDASTGQCLKTLDNEANTPITSAHFTPNPFYLVAASAGAVRVYNMHTGRVVKTLRRDGWGEPGAAGAGRGVVGCAYAKGLGRRRRGRRRGTENGVNGDGDGDDGGDGGMDVDGMATTEAGRAAMAADDESDLEGNDETETWVYAGTERGEVLVWELSTRRVAQVLSAHALLHGAGAGAERGAAGVGAGSGAAAGGAGGAGGAGIVALAVHPDSSWVATGSLEPERVIRIWRDVE